MSLILNVWCGTSRKCKNHAYTSCDLPAPLVLIHTCTIGPHPHLHHWSSSTPAPLVLIHTCTIGPHPHLHHWSSSTPAPLVLIHTCTIGPHPHLHHWSSSTPAPLVLIHTCTIGPHPHLHHWSSSTPAPLVLIHTYHDTSPTITLTTLCTIHYDAWLHQIHVGVENHFKIMEKLHCP